MTTTYATIIQDILDYSDRSDLAARAPALLEEAEYRIAQDVFPEGTNAYVTGSTAIGDRLLTKPVRCLFVKDLRLIVSGSATPLRKRDYSWLRDFAPNATTQGRPVIYADMTEDYLVLAPTPDAIYSFELRYAQRLAPLSSGNQTNFLTETYPNLLRYAAFLGTSTYLRNADDMQKYAALYDAEKARVQTIEAARMTNGG